LTTIIKRRTEMNDAETRLNAAAPDLLEALRIALARLEVAERERHYDHKTFDSNANDLAIDKAIAAINKATGDR
jgi:hypothetical protein